MRLSRGTTVRSLQVLWKYCMALVSVDANLENKFGELTSSRITATVYALRDLALISHSLVWSSMIWLDERGSHALPDSSQTERPDRASPEIRMATGHRCAARRRADAVMREPWVRAGNRGGAPCTRSACAGGEVPR